MGWFASALTIAGVATLPRRVGYLILFLGNMCWMLEGIAREDRAIILLNATLALLTLRVGTKVQD